ncbi:MAG: NAD(P)H-binding protein [Gammaproteobacteria bacterium]|nr:NAD(P)H-binding protein [Gammaproteobacteria bacterium]
MTQLVNSPKRFLVLGGSGKTGRRVIERLRRRGEEVCGISRTTTPAFDWHDSTHSWQQLLNGFDSVYVTYQPDLAIVRAADDIARLVVAARQAGVSHMVLLSGRGEKGAEDAEQIVAGSGLHYHILRASWFYQNFSEGFIHAMIKAGEVALPCGDTPEPFIDADDIAAAAVRCFTDPDIAAWLYEITGPQLLTFKHCIGQIGTITGKPLRFVNLSVEAMVDVFTSAGFDHDMVWLMRHLFSEVLDGRNSNTTGMLEKLLGRAPVSFSEYASRAFAASSAEATASEHSYIAEGAGQ